MLYLFCFLAGMLQGLSNVCTNSILNGSLVIVTNYAQLHDYLLPEMEQIGFAIGSQSKCLVSQTVFQIF